MCAAKNCFYLFVHTQIGVLFLIKVCHAEAWVGVSLATHQVHHKKIA